MRFKIFFLLLILVSVFSFTQAQNSVCTPDLTQARSLLELAQAALESGDKEGAMSLMADARNALILEEANCVNYAADTVGDKRTNPVPFGERKQFELPGDRIASIELINFESHPDAIETTGKEADIGMRYILVQYTYYCEGSPDDACSVSSLPFSAVGSENIEYQPRGNNLQDGSGDTLYGGGEITRYLVFLVKEDETDFVVRHSGSSSTFFATI